MNSLVTAVGSIVVGVVLGWFTLLGGLSAATGAKTPADASSTVVVYDRL
jgi:hypothetical protein